MHTLNTIIWTSTALALLGLSASAAEVKITKPGTHKIAENLTLQVTSHKDPDGLRRNKLTLIGTDSEGAVIVEDHCALAFGKNTWGVFAQDGTEGALITIADHWSVQTYEFYMHAERNRFRFELAGFDNEARWSMHTKDLLEGRKLSQFSDPEVVEWAKALLPTLKKPPASADEPKLEVRLLAEKEEEIIMVRPTVSRSAVNYRRLGRFINLGERLLEKNEIALTGYSTSGVMGANFGIQGVESQNRYRHLCNKHKGRKAAFVIEGQVVELFTLDPESKTFRFRAL